MNNLIVTVISIALAAVLALAGIYYGGNAFLEGQAKAQANQLISAAEQIATAWRMHAIDNNGDQSLVDTGGWGTGNPTDLVPKYMSSWPSLDIIKGSNPGVTPNYYEHIFYLESGNSVYGTFNATGIPIKVCEQIELIAKGSKVLDPVPWTEIGDHSVKFMLKPFRCWPYNTDYGFFWYRVF